MRNVRIKIINILIFVGLATYIGFFFLDDPDGSKLNTVGYSDSVSQNPEKIESITGAASEELSSVRSQETLLDIDERKNINSNSNMETEISHSVFETWNEWVERLINEDFYPSNLDEDIISALRRNPNQEIYDDLYQIFLQDEVSIEAKQLLISLLGKIATEESAQSLYKLIGDGLISNESLKKASIKAIRNFAAENWRDEPNLKIASFMEGEWDYIKDPDILSATAITLAQIGRRSTLELFSKELNTEDITNSLDVAVVQQAMTYIRNPDLVSDLSANLNNPPSELLRDSSAVALANIGTADSSEVLLNWATRASASDAERAQEWFEIAVSRSPTAILVLEKHLPTQKFDSDEIKNILENILYEAYRNTLPD